MIRYRDMTFWQLNKELGMLNNELEKRRMWSDGLTGSQREPNAAPQADQQGEPGSGTSVDRPSEAPSPAAAAPVPTPRTDALAEQIDDLTACREVLSLARQLECELGMAHKALDVATNAQENAERELAGLRAAFGDAATRMERAREILQDENSPWAMLDTVTIRAALKGTP